jgi:hypothetical protein
MRRGSASKPEQNAKQPAISKNAATAKTKMLVLTNLEAPEPAAPSLGLAGPGNH